VTRITVAGARGAPAAVIVSLAALLVTGVPAPRAAADVPAGQAGAGEVQLSSGESAAAAALARAERAPRTVAYEGVQFVSSWGSRRTTSMLVEVRHWPAKGTAVRIRGSEGQPVREVFQGDPGDASGGVAQIGQGPLGLLAANYDVVSDGDGRVAGRSAQVVAVLRQGAVGPRSPPLGRESAAARFWIDRETGLLLRREVYDSRGATVRASAFIDVSIGSTGSLTHLPPRIPGPSSTSVDEGKLDRLRAAGWICPDTLPTGLGLYDAREMQDPAGPIMHFSYSDGLTTVSLFEQRGHLDRSRLDAYLPQRLGESTVYVREGLPLRLTWSAGGRVFTVLADAPDETVRAVVGALPHEPDEDGLLDRVRRGLGRFVSWFNPFG
jgi:sigma-E factor negative regulatory protein RseB